MRVSFAGYWLCSDPSEAMRDDPPARLLDKSASREQQVIGGPDWEVKAGYDRQNNWTSISFEAQKVFDTVEEAEAYMLGYEAAEHHPWKGTIVFRLDTVTGGTSKMCVMHDAIISPPSFRYAGCRVFATYTISGGMMGAPENVTAYLFGSNNDGNLFPTGEASPAAGQAWELNGDGNLQPAAAITTDPFWENNGDGNYQPKA